MPALRSIGTFKRRVLQALGQAPSRGAIEPALKELSALTSRRDHRRAVELAQDLEALCGDDPRVLRRSRLAYSRAGELTRAHRAAGRLYEIDDTPENARLEGELAGKLQESTPGWLPAVPGARSLARQPDRGTVLHLLKASLPYRQSGYTLRARYTLEAQAAIGLRPVAMTALGFPRSIGVNEFPTVADLDGVDHIRLDADGTAGMPADAYLEAFARAAATHVRDLSPEIIHAHSGHHGFDNALVGLALGRHFDVPVVYEMRGFFEAAWTGSTDWVESSEYYRRRMAMEQFCMARANAIVTLSESMKADVVGRGVDDDKIVVVPNGVDAQHFAPRARRPDLVERYSLADTFVFGYISSLDHPRENVEVLIDAAVRLNAAGLRAKAVIVGDGERRAAIEAHAERSGASGAVVFTGRVAHTDVLDYYALLDVFVVPRLFDRASRLVTPLKPYEAMAANVPVVVSDLDALREVIGHGEYGRTFAAGDADALADVLSSLHRDPATRRTLASAARAWVTRERDWSANAHQYADLYARLRTTT